VTEIRKSYPVRVDASAEASASRGLWLVKWLLLIPHYVVLAFLWLGFVVVSVLVFFAILLTGRYPRGLFDYNVGVLRWTWRVHYYGYGALGTDRYPPFTLAEDPDYPAHLDVPYPERLSRGLVLVKWWLLAIPHYVILAVFVGGGAWFSTRGNRGDGGVWSANWGAGGLVGLLVLIAGVVLLFTGRYPRPLYEFVLGMDRWALRVAAYAGLMTDEYPPFRLDMGGPDPGSVPAGPTPSLPGGPVAPQPPSPAPHSWTAGRVVSLIVGAVLLFAAAGALLGGGAMLWADRTQRSGGYLWTPTAQISTDSHAVTSDSFRLEGAGLNWAVDNVLGRARIEVAPAAGNTDVFVGVARTPDAAGYLRGVGYTRLGNLDFGWTGGRLTAPRSTGHVGGAPTQPPGAAAIWVAQATGTGTHALTWRPSGGDWTVVVMRADGGAGVAADVRAGVTAPGLSWIAGGVLATGVVLLAIGALLVALAARRTPAPPHREAPAYGGPPAPRAPGTAETAVPTEGSPHR
jgi:catechol 2,3-dioxygenase-like lactoylglutathione lyase family enzyme